MKKHEGRRTYAVVNLINYLKKAMQEGDPEEFRKSFCSEEFSKAFGTHYTEDTVFELSHKVLFSGLDKDEAHDLYREVWSEIDDGTVTVVEEPFDPEECYKTTVENFREFARIRKSWEEADRQRP